MAVKLMTETIKTYSIIGLSEGEFCAIQAALAMLVYPGNNANRPKYPEYVKEGKVIQAVLGGMSKSEEAGPDPDDDLAGMEDEEGE